jgi:hypothetical protein
MPPVYALAKGLPHTIVLLKFEASVRSTYLTYEKEFDPCELDLNSSFNKDLGTKLRLMFPSLSVIESSYGMEMFDPDEPPDAGIERDS